MKECCVCGEKHHVRQRHEREEVSKVLEPLKSKHRTALRTVGDIAAIYQLEKWEEGERNDKAVASHVEWALEEKNALICFADLQRKNLEQHYSIYTSSNAIGLVNDSDENYFRRLNTRYYCYKKL